MVARGAHVGADRQPEERADLDGDLAALGLQDLAVDRVERLGGADLHARAGAVEIARVGEQGRVAQALEQCFEVRDRERALEDVRVALRKLESLSLLNMRGHEGDTR